MPTTDRDAPELEAAAERWAAEAPGGGADRPHRIGWQGWRQVAGRVRREVAADKLSILAAGLAFYALLAIIPGLITLVTLYSLLADPHDIGHQLDQLAVILPPDVHQLLDEQISSVAADSPAGLNVGLVVSTLVLLWSASVGIANLIRAINLCYDERESRSFLKLRLASLAITSGAIVFFILAIGGVAVLPVILDYLGLGAAANLAINVLRWPVIGLGTIFVLAVIYRLAPDRRNPKWRWVTPGAVIATVLWLLGSSLFSLYVSQLANYNEVYGSLGTVVVTLLWFFLSAFIVLLGAEINAEAEHQTVRDSTSGPDRPIGERGAFVADDLPEEN